MVERTGEDRIEWREIMVRGREFVYPIDPDNPVSTLIAGIILALYAIDDCDVDDVLRMMSVGFNTPDGGVEPLFYDCEECGDI